MDSIYSRKRINIPKIKGFSVRNLKYMKKFAKEYSEFLGKVIKEHKQGTKDINRYFYSSFQEMYNTETELYGVVEK